MSTPEDLRRSGRRRSPVRSGAAGFTLVELMIALAVLAILMMIAAPSFEMVRNSSRLAAQANELVSAIQLARSEAVRRGQRVVMCRSENGNACAGAGGNWAGWLVFADANGNGSVDAGEELLRVGDVRAPVTVAATDGSIVFRPDGFAREGNLLAAATIAVCVATTRPADNRRLVTIRSGSRVAVQTGNGNGACPAP